MFVTGGRHCFNELTVFDHAEKGDVFDIDSGLGGTHTVIYDGMDQSGRYRFHQRERDDWPAADYVFHRNEVLSKIFIIVPESVTFREWNSAVAIVHGKHYLVDKCYGIAWFEDPQGYVRLFRRNWSLASKDEADAARWRTRIERKRI